MKLHFVLFLVAIFSSAIAAQDFIFEDMFGSVFGDEYGLREKFIPEWQKIIKKNKITREVYITYTADKKYNPTSGVSDSIVIEYNSEGLPVSVTKYSEPDFKKNVILEPNYWEGKLVSLTNNLKFIRDSEGRILGHSNEKGDNYTHTYNGGKLVSVDNEFYSSFKRKGDNFVFTHEYFSEAYNQKVKDVYIYDKYGRKISESCFDIVEKYKYGKNGLISSAKRQRGDYSFDQIFTYKNDLITVIKHNNYSSFNNGFGGFFVTKVKYYK